ncbi:Protein DBF4 -like protein B [Collichthys lucidus]|uniref:Protein DBF4-like protein B n=1 Tax=Collichthys lucidus TaxID=240159 RepID=A0A4U5VMI8_COLLU|nr:Protein DBF4 -like protein B [Collichthys lucidus]
MQHQQYAEEQGLLGSLCPGQKKLEGKTFYLDNVKKRATVLLLETVTLLGGRVESFLHKDVSFVVTGSQECPKEQKSPDTKALTKGTKEEAKRPIMTRETIPCTDKRPPVTPRPVACGSRGKALLEKAIRNNVRTTAEEQRFDQRPIMGSEDFICGWYPFDSSGDKHDLMQTLIWLVWHHADAYVSFCAVVSRRYTLKKSAVNQQRNVTFIITEQCVKVYLDLVSDVLLYLKQLTRESFNAMHKRPERTYAKQQGSPVVKAAALRSPYLKIEDLSRKYKPLHMQSMTFPTLWYSGRFSPFESPPPQFEKRTEQGETKAREKKKVESSLQDKSQTPLSCNPSPWKPRKKDLSYCECCHQPFTNLDEHLQSDQHRAFVLDLSNYSVVDQLVAEMLPGFDPNPPEQSEETLNRPPTSLLIEDACELEHLTDAETEHAVQALQRQSSAFDSTMGSPSIPILKPATPLADIQPFMTNTHLQISDSHPHASSPAMPVLDAEPQAYDSASQQPDTPHLFPCPDTPCPSPDPYSRPPVLSPYPSYVMEPHSPYSEPPVLSPQQCTTEETEEGHTKMDTAESVSQFVPCVPIPLATLPLSSLTLINTEGVKGLNQGSFLGFNGIMCFASGLESAALLSRRSRSLPRPSATALNPKKRCRSASPERSRSKRRRTTAKFGHEFVKPEGCLLFDSSQMIRSCPNPKTSSTCTVETLDLKQTFTMFCVPSVHNFTGAPNQMDFSGHGSFSVSHQPSLSSKSKTFDPPLHFPNDKPPSAFSSQDSQRSLSHSTSVCIESALIPDLAALSPSSSDSDWDCDLLSRLGPTTSAPPLTAG